MRSTTERELLASVVRQSVYVAAVAAALGVGLMLWAASYAHAADQTRRGRIAAPQQPAYTLAPAEEPAYRTHNWYAGLVGGYARADDGEDLGQIGGFAGYLWRNESIGAGVEVDYVLRDISEFQFDDGIGSIRGRLGVFVAPSWFLYGTAGVAQATEAFAPDGFRQGPVVGGGVEIDVVKGAAVRAEVLHYRHGNDYTSWHDDSSTVARVGLGFKF